MKRRSFLKAVLAAPVAATGAFRAYPVIANVLVPPRGGAITYEMLERAYRMCTVSGVPIETLNPCDVAILDGDPSL